jgi:hypothetical protein
MFYDHGPKGALAITRASMLPSEPGTASAPDYPFSEAQWLAYARFPCRHFANALTSVCARLGADAIGYNLHRDGLAPFALRLSPDALPAMGPRGNENYLVRAAILFSFVLLLSFIPHVLENSRRDHAGRNEAFLY